MLSKFVPPPLSLSSWNLDRIFKSGWLIQCITYLKWYTSSWYCFASIFVYLLLYFKLEYTIWRVTLIFLTFLIRHSQYSLSFLLIFHATPSVGLWISLSTFLNYPSLIFIYVLNLLNPSCFLIFHLSFISQLSFIISFWEILKSWK